MSCQNNVRNIALACLNHESARRVFPPGANYYWRSGLNGVGWHVLILPYLEDGVINDAIQEQFREAEAENERALDIYQLEDSLNELQVSVYVCPSDGQVVDKFNKALLSSSYTGINGSAYSRLGLDAPDLIEAEGSFNGNLNIDGILFPASRIQHRAHHGRTQQDGPGRRALVPVKSLDRRRLFNRESQWQSIAGGADGAGSHDIFQRLQES